MGGAVGLAAISTVATTFTNQYSDAHAGSTSAALTHGFTSSFYVLAAFALAGAVIAATLMRPAPRPAGAESPRDESLDPMEEAA